MPNRTVLAIAAVAALLSVPSVPALALGFGRVSNQTALGQPLNFAVAVRLDGDDSLSAECVAVEVFAGDNRLAASALRIAVEPGAEPAERLLRISSNYLVDEPVLGVNLQLGCPSRLARKFVALVDPPLIASPAQAAPLPAVAPAVPAARSEATPTAVAAAAPSPIRPASRVAPRAKGRHATVAKAAPAAPRTVMLSASAPAGRVVTAPPVKTAGAAPAPAGARLELEAVEDRATRERTDLRLANGAGAVAAAGAASAAEAAASAAAEAQLARDRLQALEDRFNKLRDESQATQASLAQLQLKLRDAEAQRYTNPLVATLTVLVALLGAAVGFLLWKRHAERVAAAEWWQPPADAEAAAQEHAHDAWSMPARLAAEPQPPVPVVETTASPMLLSQGQDAAEPEREMSVEELIDLEQQAEFFVVLGQDEAAIDLLMGHLRNSGGASPLPYLKLLEIYRRRGDREAGELVREHFNRRFNAYAPDWQTDPQQGRTLLDYPQVIARLQALWATPAQAMATLEASLFRRDPGHSTFDLPAYREVLFLYAVARDLAEREARADVDLLLPIGADADPTPPLTRLLPSAAAAARGDSRAAIDVDITCVDAGPAGADERPSRLQGEFGPTSSAMLLPGEVSLTRH